MTKTILPSPAPSGSEYTPAELAELLTKAGLGTVTAAAIEADVAAGLPTTADGKVHILQYTAWLNGAGNAS